MNDDNLNMNEVLDRFLEKALELYDLPGLAVCVGRHSGAEQGSPTAAAPPPAAQNPSVAKTLPAAGQLPEINKEPTFYIKGLGYMDVSDKEPVTKRSIFHMASVTKLFVGTSIMQLWEKKLIDLEERLITYLPWFEMADERFQQITIRQLLSHTAGMPDVEDYHWSDPKIDEGALKGYICSAEVTQAHLLWAPGSGGFRYSNIGYEILGVVIAEITKMPFEEYVREHILKPLQMKDSTLLTFERGFGNNGQGNGQDGGQALPRGKAAQQEGDLQGLKLANLKKAGVCMPHTKDTFKHIVKEAHFPYNREHGPSSTLTTNMLDMAKWADAHLRRSILKPSTYEVMWQDQALVPNNGEHICLSWFRREQNGETLYGHEGTDDGFRASFWICPRRNLSITVAANLSGAAVKKIGKQIFDLLTEAVVK